MSTPHFAVSVIALAVFHAFSGAAMAAGTTAAADSAVEAAAEQAMPEVIVSATKFRANTASIAGFSNSPLLSTPASVSVPVSYTHLTLPTICSV